MKVQDFFFFFYVSSILTTLLDFITEIIQIYDGNASFRHHNFKLISVPRHTSLEQLVAAAMWAFHLTGDPGTWKFL